MHQATYWLSTTICIAVVLGRGGLALGDVADDVTSKVRKAWFDREQRVQSLRCDWTCDGVVGARTQASRRDIDGNRTQWPSNDLTIQTQCSLRIKSANKMRWDRSGPQAISALQSYEPGSYVSVTPGRGDVKSFFGNETGVRRPRWFDEGFIHRMNHIPEVESIGIRAPIVLWRPSLLTEVSVRNDEFRVIGRTIIRDHECVVCEIHPFADGRNTVVVDPARDYIPLRWVRKYQIDGEWKTSYQVDWRYVLGADEKGSLEGWRHTLYALNGTVIEHGTCTVTTLEENGTISDTTFDFEFPVGTRVYDKRDPRNEQEYIIRDGGKKRLITKAERRARVPYERLVATRSGEGVSLPGRGRRRVILVVLSLGTVTITLLVYMLRRAGRLRIR